LSAEKKSNGSNGIAQSGRSASKYSELARAIGLRYPSVE
jgi:hypothetical protein